MLLKNKKFWLTIIIIFTLLNSLIIFLPSVKDLSKEIFTQIFSQIFTRQTGWYAVHLTNSQVYFGRIKSVTNETITLKDTYYFETFTTQPTEAQGESFQVQTEPQTTYTLTRRGGDQFMTTDNVLFINRAVVLFWEKLLATSSVVSTIEQTENQNK